MSYSIDGEAPAERWLTKRELAAHYGYSTRWVELQQPLGLPSRLIGRRRRYRLSEVDAWLREKYSAAAAPTG